MEMPCAAWLPLSSIDRQLPAAAALAAAAVAVAAAAAPVRGALAAGCAVRGKDLQPGGRQGQAGLSLRDTGHDKHGRGFEFYQHMLKVRRELKVRSIAQVIRPSSASIVPSSLIP